MKKKSVAKLNMAQQYYNANFHSVNNKVVDCFCVSNEEYNILCLIMEDEMGNDGIEPKDVTIAIKGGNLTPQQIIKLFQYLGYDEAMEVPAR